MFKNTLDQFVRTYDISAKEKPVVPRELREVSEDMCRESVAKCIRARLAKGCCNSPGYICFVDLSIFANIQHVVFLRTDSRKSFVKAA